MRWILQVVHRDDRFGLCGAPHQRNKLSLMTDKMWLFATSTPTFEMIALRSLSSDDLGARYRVALFATVQLLPFHDGL
jgi:hypothetical protein